MVNSDGRRRAEKGKIVMWRKTHLNYNIQTYKQKCFIVNVQ